MKVMNNAEMKNTNGGILIYAGAFLGGCYIGIKNKIKSDHKKYGKCRTYKSFCSKCR